LIPEGLERDKEPFPVILQTRPANLLRGFKKSKKEYLRLFLKVFY